MATKLTSSATLRLSLVERYQMHSSHTKHWVTLRYQPSSIRPGTQDASSACSNSLYTSANKDVFAAISDNLWLTGSDKTLNPEKFYIIIPALFGNGQSSSPSNMPDLRPFPDVLMYDNVRAQHELVTKHLGIKHARAVLGWSMGAGQT